MRWLRSRYLMALLFGWCWLYAGMSLPVLDAQDRAIRLYQEKLRRNPSDASAYYRLGDAYIQKARVNSDFNYYNLAEQALRKSLEIAPMESGVIRHLAYVLYTRHAFEEAVTQASSALELNPADSHAYGILGDALQETGRYEEAREAFQKMIHLQADLYSYSRLSAMKSLGGDTTGALEDLKKALFDGREARRPAESVAWVLWQMGNEHLAVGDLPAADASYSEALRILPGYYRALAGLAQVRVAREHYTEAVELYDRAISVVPQPDYAAALGDIYIRTNQTDKARKQYELVEFIGFLNGLNKEIYNRELAYFYADHDLKIEKALELAQKEIGLRKDIYAYDLLAWALYRNGRYEDASAAMAQALRLGTEDARLFFHAGMIQRRLGNCKEARAYLMRALAIHPRFHIFNADAARNILEAEECGEQAASKRETDNAP